MAFSKAARKARRKQRETSGGGSYTELLGAGNKAARDGLPLSANPHSDEDDRQIWEEGHNEITSGLGKAHGGKAKKRADRHAR